MASSCFVRLSYQNSPELSAEISFFPFREKPKNTYAFHGNQREVFSVRLKMFLNEYGKEMLKFCKDFISAFITVIMVVSRHPLLIHFSTEFCSFLNFAL